MDRHEFHRIAHLYERERERTRRANTVDGRYSGSTPDRTILTLPRGSFIVRPGTCIAGEPFLQPMDKIYPRIQQRQVSQPIMLNVATRRDETCRNLTGSLRSLGDRYGRSEESMRVTRRHDSMYGPYRPPCTTPYVGLITRSLVGRPVRQFRGSTSPGNQSTKQNNVKRPQPMPVVNLLDDEGNSNDSLQKTPERAPKENAWNAVVSKTSVWNSNNAASQLPALCFSSNGFMQMEMIPSHAIRKQSTPPETVMYEDGVSAEELESLGIAQQIVSRPILTQHKFSAVPIAKLHRESTTDCEVLNLLSDEEEDEMQSEHTSEPVIEKRTVSEAEEPPACDRVLECLQPLLNAIEIVSRTQEPCSSGKRAVSEIDETEIEPRQSRKRPATRSLNAMAREMWQRTTQRVLRNKLRKGLRARSLLGDREGSTEFLTEKQLDEMSIESLQPKRKRQSQSEDETPADNTTDPYRKIYLTSAHHRKFQEVRRFMNGPSKDDPEEIHQLWEFLNDGVQPSPSFAEMDARQHPLPVTAEECCESDVLKEFVAILTKHASRGTTDDDDHLAAENGIKPIKTMNEEPTESKLQYLVQKNTLVGFMHHLLMLQRS